jgi:predicted small secreted protein
VLARCIEAITQEVFMKYVILCAFAVATILLTGCNTIAGAGRDIEEAGDAIEDTAEENRN